MSKDLIVSNELDLEQEDTETDWAMQAEKN
jgi:hypothetical protein